MKAIIEKLKKKRLIKDYLWVFLGQNISSVFSMISVIVTLRIITSYDYGSLVIIQTYCLLVSNIFCIRTFNGIIKYIAEAEQKNNSILVKQYLNTAFLLDFAMGIIAFVFAFILLDPITKLMGWNQETVSFVYWYMPAIITYPLLNGVPTGILRKTGHFKEVNIVHAFVYGLQLMGLLITWVGNFGTFKIVLLEYAVIEILESIILMVVAILIMQKENKYRDCWKAGISKDISFFKYNIFFGLLSTFDQLLGNVSTLLINKYIGNLATAYLKIITRICSILAKFTNPISQVFFPELCEWIAKKQYRKALNICKKYFLVAFTCGITILGLMYATYEQWIGVFDSGMESVKMQSILYLAFSILSMAFICLHQLSLALDMMTFNVIFVGIVDVLYIVLLIPCINMYGVEGYLFLQIAQLLVVAAGKYIFIMRYIKKGEKSKYEF